MCVRVCVKERERQNEVKGQVHRYRQREVYRRQVKSNEGERGVENERA